MRDAIEREISVFSDFLTQIKPAQLSDYKHSFFKKIDALARMIEQSSDPQYYADKLFKACHILEESHLHERTRTKPLGYAGDFLLIDWIYTHRTTDNGPGRIFDELFHQYEAAIAVRNRKSYFIEKCKNLAKPGLKRVDILNLGCGPCRDVLEACEYCGNGTAFHFHCVDHEPEAIHYSKRLIQNSAAKPNIRLEHANVFRLKTDKRYDLIWSAGLFDYLKNRRALTLIKRNWALLKPGGQFVFGNFAPRNPTRRGMELIGQWHLIHRSAEELMDLCKQAGLNYKKIEIEKEPLGINLFCVIHKKKERAESSG